MMSPDRRIAEIIRMVAIHIPYLCVLAMLVWALSIALSGCATCDDGEPCEATYPTYDTFWRK